MTRLLAGCALLGTMLLAAGCGETPTDQADSGTCPQTYEFGNYGCARIVVMVEGPPQPWPAFYRWDVRAVPAREGSGGDVAFSPRPDTGMVPLQVTRWHSPGPGSEDTASVWVAARLLEDPRPIQSGVPLPTFAADSVLHVARFARVGERPPTDTVWLTLQRR